MPGQRLGTVVFSALLFLSLSCDKAGPDTPLEPVYEEPQDAAISGTVTVGEAGLEGVEITLSGPESASMPTDAQGAFSFTQLKRGDYSVVLWGFDPAIHAFSTTQLSVVAVGGIDVKVEFVGSLVPQPPPAPDGLQAAATGPESVDLSWKDTSADETGFKVQRRIGAEGAWDAAGATGADTASFSESALTPNTTYSYRVQACNDAGCSAFTPEVQVTTDEVPPAPPEGLVAEADGTSAIYLAWSDRSENEGEFQVERRGPADSAWTALAHTAADVSTYSDQGLNPAATFVYRVRACNQAGCSPFTDEASGTTDDIPPEAPTSLSAQADGSSAADLDWTDESDNESEFQIERRDGTEGGWSAVATTNADEDAFRDQGLIPLTAYTYRVRACNDFGCSEFSGEASTTTGEPVPEPPTGLSAVSTGPGSIELAWTDRSEIETGFNVQRQTSGGGGWVQIASPGPNTTAFDDSGLASGTEYGYRVQACNAGGCSGFSNEATATTEVVFGPNLFISALYITQSTQTLDGGVPLVANKAGYLRVFALADGANDLEPEVRVDFYHGPNLVHTETISAPGTSVPTSLSEASLAYSWNVGVAQWLIVPGLSVLAEVDPGNGVSEADESDNRFPVGGSPLGLDVRNTSRFEVTFVPVRQNVNGLVGNVTAGNTDSFLDDAMEMLPIAESDADLHSEYATDAPALESDNANGAWGTILSEVSALRATEGSSRNYYGVVKTGYSSGVAGMGYLGWPIAVGWDRLPSGSSVAAHEWGHNWNRRHAPGCGAGSPDASYPYADGKIGVWGMNVGPNSLKSPASTYDFMSYCGPEWVSDYSYGAILAEMQTAPAMRVPAGKEPALLVWGRVEAGRIVLEPAFQVTTTPSLPAEAGAYRIEGTDVGGAPLFSLSFEPIPVPDGNPGEGHFAFAIPLSLFDEGGLARIRAVGGGRDPGIIQARTGPEATEAPVPELRPSGGSVVEITWDATSHPMAMVRDAATGEVLSFARGGSVRFPISSAEIEVAFSDGLRSSPPIRRRVR